MDNMNNNKDLILLLNKAQHENTLLKTEFEHIIHQHKQELDFINKSHQKQIADLQKTIEDSVKQHSNDNQDLSWKYKKLLQSNEQFKLELKLSEDKLNLQTKEYEEKKKEVKQVEGHFQNILDQREAQIYDFKEKNLQLEERLKLVIATDQKQYNTKSQENSTHQIHLLESQLIELKQDYSSQIDAANMEAKKYQNKCQHLEDSLYVQKNELKLKEAELKDMKTDYDHQISDLRNKLGKELSDLNLKYISETSELTHQNNSLSEKLQDLLKTTPGVCSTTQEECAKLSLKLETKTRELASLYKETTLMKTKLAQMEELKESLSKEKESTEGLRRSIETMALQCQETKANLAQLNQSEKTLIDKLHATEEQLRNTYMDLRKEKAQCQKRLVDLKLKEDDQWAQSKSRTLALETQLKARTKYHQEEAKELKKKVRMYGQLIKKLRFKLEMGDVKGQELEARHEAVKDQNECVRNQLQGLLHKHAQFMAHVSNINKEKATEEMHGLEHQISFMTDQLSELEQSQREILSDYDLI